MEDQSKTKQVLIKELASLRQKIAEQEQANLILKYAEEKYRSIIENAVEGIFQATLEGRYISVNPALARMFRYDSPEDMMSSVVDIGRQLYVDPKQRKKLLRLLNEKSVVENYEVQVYRKDGSIIWVSISTRTVRDHVTNLLHHEGFVTDITERKRAEKEIQNLARFPSENPNPVLRIARDGTLLYINKAGLDMLPDLHLQVGQAVPPILSKSTLQSMENGSTQILYLEHGQQVFSFTIGPVVDSGYANLYGNDITEHKQAEEALRESEKRYHLLFEEAQDGIALAEAETGKIIDCNRALCRMMERDKTDLMGQPQRILHPQDEIKNGYSPSFRLHKTGDPGRSLEDNLLSKSGNLIPVEIRASSVRMNERDYLFGIFRDITDRKRAEEALRKEKDFAESLIQTAQTIILVLDTTGHIVSFNPYMEEISGYPLKEVQGKEWFSTFLPEQDRDRIRQIYLKAISDVQTRGNINPIITKDGKERYIEWYDKALKDSEGKIAGLLSIGQDITDRMKSEEDLKETLKSLRKAVGTTIQVMISAIEVRDPYTAGHQMRSTDLACAIATEMGLPQEKIDGIRMAGSIHDIGKLSIPAEILSKPVKLSEIEFTLIKDHSRSGYEMLKDVESPWPLAEIVYQHHERMDGSGYPRNLKGDEILIEARILGVADVVEAMASHRPYRPTLGIDEALKEIENNKGTLFDADVVDACIRLFREKDYQFEKL